MPRKSGLGQGGPISDGLRSSTGVREVWPRSGRTRMSGRAFSLVTFSLREQRESDSAGGPKPRSLQSLGNQPGARRSLCQTAQSLASAGRRASQDGCPRWSVGTIGIALHVGLCSPTYALLVQAAHRHPQNHPYVPHTLSSVFNDLPGATRLSPTAFRQTPTPTGPGALS